MQKAGTTYDGNIVVTATASASAPILISSYGAGTAPVIAGTVDLDGAANVTVAGLSISGSTGAGICLQNGAANDTIEYNWVQNAQTGIWIGSGAGAGNRIASNLVSDNSAFGIAISGVSSSVETAQSVIEGNVVWDNGSHGIELNGNGFLIDRNSLFLNGTAVPGSSGIHAYAAGATDGFGNFNTITVNVVIGTQDSATQDGNGIELDQWTHGNLVSDNLAFANQGAGIVLYDSHGNTVSGNVAIANGLNASGRHAIIGDIVLNAALGLTTGNTIIGNTGLALAAGATAIYADPASAKGANTFADNVWENLSGGSIYDWGNVAGSDLSYWSAIAPSDAFSGVRTFNAASYAGSYGFSFDNAPLTLDGATVQLVGWTPDSGLGVMN